jgi:hypothetical protein
MLWYAVRMKNLFNKSFYRFTMGFLGILLVSFVLTAIVTNLDAEKNVSAAAQAGK